MAKLQVMLFVAFLFFALMQTGSTLHCYKCTQATNAHCKDYFTKVVPKLQCPQGFICIKHKQPAITINDGDNNAKNLSATIIRDCKPKDYCKHVNHFSDFCQGCTEDYCNSSFRMAPVISPLAVVLLITNKVFFL